MQAAVVLTGESFHDVADRWALRRGQVVEPDPTFDGASVRAAYAREAERAGAPGRADVSN